MAAIYYEDVDVMGHRFGPESAEVRRAVEQVDQVLQILLSQIKVRHVTTVSTAPPWTVIRSRCSAPPAGEPHGGAAEHRAVL